MIDVRRCCLSRCGYSPRRPVISLIFKSQLNRILTVKVKKNVEFFVGMQMFIWGGGGNNSV